jgi:hypothetical protein
MNLAMVIFVVILATSAAILAYLPAPFLWIALLWVGMLCVLAIKRKHSSLRAVWINLAVVVITLGAMELYFHSQEVERMVGSHTEGYYEEHKVLGYCPASGRKSRAIKYHGDKLVYDVNYHIDRRGLRVSPPVQDPPACGGVLFFGGSFTFGEGVEDHQAMPYLTGVRTDGHYAIDNFGFHGYGPHQMLAALELGIVDKIVSETVSYVIYQAIPAHVARSAGRVKWDRHGPKFILDSNGKPVYSGHFDDELPHSIRWLRKQLDKSALYRWSVSQLREATTEEIALYTAIVAAARDAANRKFPDAEFHVLLWGTQGEMTYDAILDGLNDAGVNVHPVNEILPGYATDPGAYEISPFDRHPNPHAHEQIAGYVSTRILHGSSCEDPVPLVVSATR